jgi:Domain of unknown function (DUF1996)
MPSRAVVKLALAVTLLAALAVSFVPRGRAQASAAGGAQASATGGVFIVRCFWNGSVAPEDPIIAPTSFHTDHLHAFFGNMAGGGSASDGTAFPNMRAGDDGSAGTMEHNGLTSPTNCQDTKDTAGYWIPEPFTVSPSGTPSPQLPGGGCSDSSTCHPGTNLHMRVYYIPHGATPNQEIPDGTIMVTGYPNGCANVQNLGVPAGCNTGTSYPVDVNNPDPSVPEIVEYGCGADTAHHLGTPVSAWPYDCTKYTDADDSFSDGAVAFVNFPDCWDGQTGNFAAPNSAVNQQTGIATKLVPGYVAPWIPYKTPTKYFGMPSRPANDFAYSSNGDCKDSNFPIPVVQLQERTHLLTFGQGWGPPSACTSDGGIRWNTTDNAENSTTSSDSGEAGGNDHDPGGLVQVNNTPLYGFQKCPSNVTAPSPDSTASTLSFACSSGGDPNCNLPLSTPSGCVSAGGTCYVGPWKLGWETLHADYWQTWQEAASQNSQLDQNNGFDFPSDVGTFGDVVEDCADDGVKCTPEFVNSTTSTPSQVYGPNPGVSPAP